MDTNVKKWKIIYVPEQIAGYLKKNMNFLFNPCFAVENEGTSSLLNVGNKL
jgi:hypothetical protein